MRIYPIYDEFKAPNLVSADLIAPTKIPGSEDLTQLLRFDKPVDLLAIGQTSAMLDSGILDVTDMLDENIRVMKIAYSVPVKKGKPGQREVKYADVTHLSASKFKRSTSGNYATVDMMLKMPLAGGIFMMQASINLGTGTLKVEASNDNPEVELIGFELEAYRFNPNRRPASPGSVNSALTGWKSGGRNPSDGRLKANRDARRKREIED